MAQQQSTAEYAERYALVPQELRDCPQWVAYKREWDRNHNKLTKVPVNPLTGNNASSTNPGTWGTYEQALAACEEFPYAVGIGFVFSEADRYVGIDLDGCIDVEGNILPSAQAIIDRVPSYAEKSPSGNGVHIICNASWQGRGRKIGNIEIYNAGRFFTVTGAHLSGTPLEVVDCSEAVTRLQEEIMPPAPIQPRSSTSSRGICTSTATVQRTVPPLTSADQHVLAKLRRKASGAETLALLSGSRNGHPSQSEAEFSAAKNLMYWCDGKVEQADRIIRNHPIYRKKWDEVHGDETYGQRTLRKAHEYYLSKKEER